MSKAKQKELDAVQMMREIRDDLSRKLSTMTHEEQSQYIQEQLAHPAASEDEPSRLHSTV